MKIKRKLKIAEIKIKSNFESGFITINFILKIILMNSLPNCQI